MDVKEKIELIDQHIELVNKKMDLLQAEQNKPEKKKGISPALATIWVAIISGTFTICLNIWQSSKETARQQKKSEQELLFKLIVNENLEQTKKNIDFFIRSGFLTGDSLAKLINDSTKLPVIVNGLEQSKNLAKSLLIQSPRSGDMLPSSNNNIYEISGISTQSVLQKYDIWLFSQSEFSALQYFPLAPVDIAATNKWSVPATISLNGKVRLCICLVSQKASKTIYERIKRNDFSAITKEDLDYELWTIDYIDVIKK